MNLAGHRDRRLSENYFEPCYLDFLWSETVVNLVIRAFGIQSAFPVFHTTTTRLPKDFSTRGVFEDDHPVQQDFGEKTGTVLFVCLFFLWGGGRVGGWECKPCAIF